jgi:hypothetical protein
MNIVVLNNTNVIGSLNSQFKFNFINGSFKINEGSMMCVSQVSIPYSWYNINPIFYNNATISYRWYRGAGLYDTYTCVFPAGFYTTTDLNNYLNQFMLSNNQYFYNSLANQNIYYISIQTNVNYYSNQLILNTIPTSLPSGYSLPSIVINGYTYTGFNCNPTTAGPTGGTTSYYPSSSSYNFTPMVIISSYTGNASIGSILGFTAGSYPSTTSLTNVSILSNVTPNSSPVNSLVIRTNITSNNSSFPSDIQDTMPINVSFGSLLNYSPFYEKWNHLKAGLYDSFVVSICDQNYNTIYANDPNVLISFIIKQGPNVEYPLYKSIKSLNFSDKVASDEQQL